MRNVLLGAFLGFIGSLVAGVFVAMMTVPESAAITNLKTFGLTLGLAPRVGLLLGLGIVAIGVILVAVSLRNRKSSGHAIVEAQRIIGSEIENNYSERSDLIVKANVLRDSSVRRNILNNPDGKADE